MRGQLGHNIRPHARSHPEFPLHGCMDNLRIERSLDLQATWVIDVLGFFDMLSMGVCTTSHWQTSGRLVQELNVSTVGSVIRELKALNC